MTPSFLLRPSHVRALPHVVASLVCCALKLACLRAFGSIWGAGRAKAEELYALGFRTIEDVRERGRDRLTRQQLVGLDR